MQEKKIIKIYIRFTNNLLAVALPNRDGEVRTEHVKTEKPDFSYKTKTGSRIKPKKPPPPPKKKEDKPPCSLSSIQM